MGHFKLLNNSYRMKLIILMVVSGLVSLGVCDSLMYASYLSIYSPSAVRKNFDAVFVSKNFPERNMGVESKGNRGLLTSDNPSFQRFKVVQGLCGVEGTISFESLETPGYYLRHQGFEIYLRKEEDTDLYRKDSCFFPRYNKYFQGYTAYESENYRNYFIRHRGSELYIDPAEDKDLYKKDASWKTRILDQGQSFRNKLVEKY